MDNFRAIQPVNLWLDGTSQQAHVLTLDNYTGYDFKGNPGQISWTLNAYTYGVDENQQPVVGLQPLTSGRLELTTTVADTWGADDQVVFDFVAASLNLTLI